MILLVFRNLQEKALASDMITGENTHGKVCYPYWQLQVVAKTIPWPLTECQACPCQSSALPVLEGHLLFQCDMGIRFFFPINAVIIQKQHNLPSLISSI